MTNHAFPRVGASGFDPRSFSPDGPSPDLVAVADQISDALHALAESLHSLRSLAGVVDPDAPAPVMAPIPTRSADAMAEDLGAMALAVDLEFRTPASLSAELLQFARDLRAMKALAAIQGVAL